MGMINSKDFENPGFERGMHSKRAIVLTVALIVSFALLSVPPVTRGAATTQTGSKLVLAFHYMWFSPADFNKGQMSDRPVSPYNSEQAEVIDRQVREAKGAGIDGFISAWTGTGTPTDALFQRLLDTAKTHNFQATIYFETNSVIARGDAATQLQSALNRFGSHPAFLKWNGKPVIFFWSPQSLGSPEAWRAVRQRVDPNNSQVWSVDTTDRAY